MKIFKNSKNQNGGRYEGFKKERSKNGNSKKGNLPFWEGLKTSLKRFLNFFFFGITIFGSLLLETFISAPILIFGIFENLHKSIIDFLILTRSRGKTEKSDSDSICTSDFHKSLGMTRTCWQPCQLGLQVVVTMKSGFPHCHASTRESATLFDRNRCEPVKLAGSENASVVSLSSSRSVSGGKSNDSCHFPCQIYSSHSSSICENMLHMYSQPKQLKAGFSEKASFVIFALSPLECWMHSLTPAGSPMWK